jgi:uncharacterized protein (UPF0210 family)
MYLGIQLAGIVTAILTGTVAATIRQLLEAANASSQLTTIGVLAGAAVPWSIAMTWHLGDPELEPLRARLPAAYARLVEALRKRTGPTSAAGITLAGTTD